MEQILLVSSILLWIFVTLNLLLSLAVIRRLNSFNFSNRQEDFQPLGIGQPAPEFKAENINGTTTTLSNYLEQGAVAFIFISPGCGPCRTKLPSLEALQFRTSQKNIQLVLVSEAEHAETVALVREFELTLPTLIAPRLSNPFMEDYKVVGTPYFCLVSSEGKVQATGSLLGPEWDKFTSQWVQINASKDVSSLILNSA